MIKYPGISARAFFCIAVVYEELHYSELSVEGGCQAAYDAHGEGAEPYGAALSEEVGLAYSGKGHSDRHAPQTADGYAPVRKRRSVASHNVDLDVVLYQVVGEVLHEWGGMA